MVVMVVLQLLASSDDDTLSNFEDVTVLSNFSAAFCVVELSSSIVPSELGESAMACGLYEGPSTS